MRIQLVLGAAALALVACAKSGGEDCKPTTPVARTQACAVESPQASSNDERGHDTLVSEEPSPLAPTTPSMENAIALIREALQADQAGNLDLCITKEKEALKLDDSPRARLHLASCESRNGKLVDSLKDSERALEGGIMKRDASVMKVARARVQETLVRVPHITFRKAGPPPLKLTFDGKDVPYDAADKKFSVDPGLHVVEVTHADGVSRCEVNVAERTFTPVTIR